MIRLILLTVSLVLAAPLASAQRLYVAPMVGDNVLPSGSGSGGSGVAVGVLQPDGTTLVLSGRFDSIGTTVTEVHLHIGDRDEDGPVAFELVSLGVVTVDAISGSTPDGGRFDGSVTLTPAQAQDFLFEGMHVDAHVNNDPEAKIRGQFQPDQGTALQISGVVEGSADGGTDDLKAIELWVREDIADLSVYAVSGVGAGGGTDGAEYPLSGSASAGDYLYVACSAGTGTTTFTSFFGFAPTFEVASRGPCDLGGDDPVELYYESIGRFDGSNSEGSGARGRASVIDTFGDIAIDGSDTAWDYRDGWAYRRFGNDNSGRVFAEAEWVFSGVNALDGAATNAGLSNPFPTATFSPGSVTADAAGYRLVGAPGAGLTVTDLAILNLVQGVAAGSDPALYPAQYSGADDVLYTSYTGTYGSPTDASEVLEAGKGFFWYLFDQDFDPMDDASGRSIGRDMNGFYFPIMGTQLSTTVNQTFANSSDGFYMLANPFQDAYALSSISSSVGTVAASFFAWDPTLNAGAGDYETVTAGTDAIQPWQGVFGEITDGGAPVSGSPVVTYDATGISPDETGVSTSPFYGRQSARQEVALTLDGTLASGVRVGDHVADVRISAGATLGWDLFDLSELAPPYSDQARLAIGGERGDATYPQAVFSISEDIGSGLTLPVMMSASQSGTFAVSWSAATLPAGWSATITDTESGASASLTEAGRLAFTAEAGDWATRFELALSTSGTDTETGAESAFVGDAFPNPTSGRATVTVRVAQAQTVRADVFDALGRHVAVAFDGALGADVQQDVSIGDGLAAGVYVVRIEGQDFVTSRRLVVTR